MKKRIIYLRFVWGIFSFLFFVPLLHGQYINPRSNPSPIIPSGKALEFTAVLSPGNNPDSYFLAYAPADWTIIETNPAGIISGDGATARISFSGITVDTEISVCMKPGCDIQEDTQVRYEFYGNSDNLLASNASPVISNIDYPAFIFTAPTDTTFTQGTEGYREWSIVQTVTDAYVLGGDLTMNVVSEPGYYSNTAAPYALITDVEMLTNTGWESLNPDIASDQLSYSYTFTAEDFKKIGDGDTILTNTEIIRVREKLFYLYCSGYNYTPSVQAKLFYTPSHRCNQSKINTGEAVVNYMSASSFGVSYSRMIMPQGPNIPGEVTLRIYNNTLSPIYNLYHQFYTASTGYTIRIQEIYFSNASGVEDTTAPAISFRYEDTNDYRVYIEYTSTTTYKNLQALEGDGICNDLVPSSEYIYVTFKWYPDFTHAGNCENGPNNLLFGHTINRYFYHTNPGCSNTLNRSNTYTGEYLGFGGWLGYMSDPNLIYYPESGSGTQTVMIITESPANNTYKNTTALKSGSEVTHQVELIIPSDLKYVPEDGVTINGIAVATTDITYNATTNTLIFYNRDPSTMTSDITYSFTVEAASGTNASDKNMKISHIFNWGDEPYYYGCSDIPLTYIVRIPGECDYINATTYRAERTSLGFKDKSFVAFSSLQEARDAGADLSVAGPYDHVEFEINAIVSGEDVYQDDGQPLYADVFYSGNPNAAQPYFSKGKGAVMQYQKPDEAWSDSIFIPADDLELLFESNTHHLRVDISPFLIAKEVSLLKGTRLKVTFLSQTTEYLPVEKTAAELLQLGIYREGRNVWDCNEHAENFFVWDYQLQQTSNSGRIPYDILYWQNAQENYSTAILLQLSMNNGISGLTEEIFPNEFRPNGIVNGFQWQWHSTGSSSNRTVLVDRVYDSEGREFYEGSDYTVSHTTSGTKITFNSDLNAYTGEYYNESDDLAAGEKGKHTYYIFADLRSVCAASASSNSVYYLYVADFPTSANPVTKSPAVYYTNMAYGYSTWNISTTTTAASHTTPERTFSWPLTLTNKSVWTDSSNPADPDYTLPYTYLFVEVTEGEVEEFELYKVEGGSQVKVEAPFEEYTGRSGYRSFWIKIGEVEGITNGSSVVNDFILKAKQPDCTRNNVLKLTAEFGVNSFMYPDDPYSGFLAFNGSPCRQAIPSLALTGTFHLTDFSGAVDESAGMDADGKFELCTPIPMTVTFQNNLYGPVHSLQVKIARNTASSLVLENPSMTLSYTQNGSTYLYDPSWEIDDTQEEYILIKLPPAVTLASKDDPGDHVVINVSVTPMCDFLFGRPIYMDVIGTSMCEVTERKNIATSNIRLSGYDEDGNPRSQLTAFSMEKIKDNSSGPVYSLLEEADRAFKLKGTFIYQTVQSDILGEATIKLPAYMESLPGGINRFERVGGPGTGEASSNFILSRNMYRAQFNSTESTPATYEFELDIQITDYQVWSCEDYTIEIGSVVNIEMYCDPADPSPCNIDYSTLSNLYTFTIEKYDLAMIAGEISFTEYYDYNAGAGRLKINASVVNNSTYDMEGAAFYLYKDSNRNGIYDEEDILLLPGPLFTLDILAGDKVHPEVIIPTPTADELCDLMLVIPCHSGINRFLCDSTFVKKEVVYELATTEYRICQGTELVIGDPSIGNYAYTWSTTGSGLFSNPAASQPKYTYPLTASLNGDLQTQLLKLTLNRDPAGTFNCTPEDIYVKVYIEPITSEWTGNSNSNWEDTNNWNNGIPGKCTYVTIPAQADYYPVLTREMTDELAAKCDTIEFLHGGEVAKTYLLDYNAAKVNLTLDPDRWTMVASPLRYMYTGDYYVNGYDPNALTWGRTPDVYWMYYRMANPENEQYYNADYYWSMPFNVLEEPMQAGKGLVIWPDLETNMGTGSLSGRIPPADNKARFTFPRMQDEYYYYNGNGFNDPSYTGTENAGDIATHPETGLEWKVELNRKQIPAGDSLRSRFTYEGLSSYNSSTGNFTMQTYVDDVLSPTALVGNPFMSHLDLRTFQQANASMITQDFYIWADNTSGGFFEAVKLLSGMDHLSTLAANATIPPMQSFVVVKQADPVTFGSLTMTPAMSVTTPTSKLRSATAGEEINIALYTLNSRESAVTLLFREGTPNEFDKEKDQYTLFPTDKFSRILYAIAEEEGERRAVSIHSVGDIFRPVPLAIRTDKTGDLLTLKVSGTSDMASGTTLYLEDTERGVMQNLMRQPEYTFTNFSGNIPEGRFYLRFIENTTAIEEICQNKDFYVYPTGCRINIYSEGDPAQQIRMYNLQGQQIEYIPHIHEELFSFELKDCREQILIIRIQTEKEIMVRKILIKP